MKRVLLIILLLLVPIAYAQLDPAITKLRCGNGKLDRFEMCEKGTKQGYCEAWGALLNIAYACNEKTCNCVPKINPVYCGNNRRESTELCDGTDKDDRCPKLSQIMNLTLVCDSKTCGCKIDEALPSDYNPAELMSLVNATGIASVCGDRKIERSEECDPPNTLCTTNTKEPGVCTGKCKCVTPEMLQNTEKQAANGSNSSAPSQNTTVAAQAPKLESNRSSNPALSESPKEEESQGFFGSMWAWIVTLFS